MGWIDKLVYMHSELESPKNFWFWSGLTAISAVLKDNVYLDKYAYKLYPNIYVMLHADSGLKKGPPVGLAKDLVKRVNNTRIISGRSSIQGILKELGTAQSAPGKAPITKSVGFICASEFSSSLVSDPVAMTILTDLYDRQYNEGDWKSLLKMDSFSLKDPTISLLVATNEAHFEDFIQAKDMHGGFIGRMFVIAETETNRLNALVRRPNIVPNREDLANDLKEMAKLSGAFRTLEDTTAGELYETWYNDFYTAIKKNKIKDETGTIQRFGDSVLKVAMLLAVSESCSLEISEEVMAQSIELCEKLIGNVRKTTLGKNKKGTSDVHASIKALIIKELLERDNHMITRAVLAKKLVMYVGVDEVDKIMASFHESGLIITENNGTTVYYTMPQAQVDEMMNWLRGRS